MNIFFDPALSMTFFNDGGGGGGLQLDFRSNRSSDKKKVYISL